MILALDTATKTGWALILRGSVYESGVQDFSKKRGESNGIMFIRFRRWLTDMLKESKPDMVVYEQTGHSFKNASAMEIAFNLSGRAQEIADEHFVPYTTYTPSALKKFATGKGNADKKAMVEAVYDRIGKRVESDDEADAILLGLMAWEEYGV